MRIDTRRPAFVSSLLALLGLAAAACLTFGSSLSAEEIASKIEASLQTGATVEEIQDYIASDPKDLGLQDHEPTAGHARDHSRLTDEFRLDPAAPIYVAIIRDRGDQFNVVFVLDEDLLYQRLIVFEEHQAGL